MEEDKQYVTESTDGEKPATSELVLSLTSDDTAFLSKIDRICFKITACTGKCYWCAFEGYAMAEGDKCQTVCARWSECGFELIMNEKK